MTFDESAAELNLRSWAFAAEYHQRASAGVLEALARRDQFVDPLVEKWFDGLSNDCLLHLFCGDAKESISLALRSAPAARLMGVDFNPVSVLAGRSLMRALGVSGEIDCAEVGRWLQSAASEHDQVLMTLGSLWWISDLPRMLESLAHLSKRGTGLTIWDFDDAVVFGRISGSTPSIVEWPDGVEDYYGDGRVALPGIMRRNLSAMPNPYPVRQYLRSVESTVEAIQRTGWFVHDVDRIRGVFGERYDQSWIPIEGGRFVPPASNPSETHSVIIRATLRL